VLDKVVRNKVIYKGGVVKAFYKAYVVKAFYNAYVVKIKCSGCT